MTTTKNVAANRKPSDFCSYPWSSVLQTTESEVVAENIMKILRRTGDQWRELTWEEYQAERMKDGRFSTMERRFFDQVWPLISSPELAAKFSSEWRSA